MKRIKNWKLFESVYQDSIDQLDSLKKEIIKVRANYLAEVKNCLWDIIDDFECEYMSDSVMAQSPERLTCPFKIEFDPDKLEELLNLLIEANNKCLSHIGNPIHFEWIGFTLHNQQQNLSQTSLSVLLKTDFSKKIDALRVGLSKFLDDAKSTDYGKIDKFSIIIYI
jgi:hypothetical protein